MKIVVSRLVNGPRPIHILFPVLQLQTKVKTIKVIVRNFLVGNVDEISFSEGASIGKVILGNLWGAPESSCSWTALSLTMVALGADICSQHLELIP